jgi:hypothetical protein
MANQRTAVKCSLIGISFLLLAAPVFSQQPPGPPADRNNPDRERQLDRSNREWQLRNFGIQPDSQPDRKQLEALMAQTEQDFNRILILHNEIVRAISSARALDYDFVSNATGEIRKRATRLQSTLGLRQSPEEAQVAEKPEKVDDPQINDELVKLCKQIKSFVTNPVIENPNTVNAQELIKARRHLEALIQLSGEIKKHADKLGRTRK